MKREELLTKIVSQSRVITEKITDFMVSFYGSAGEHIGWTFLSLGVLLNLVIMLIPAYNFYNVLNLDIIASMKRGTFS